MKEYRSKTNEIEKVAKIRSMRVNEFLQVNEMITIVKGLRKQKKNTNTANY